jgi:Xaa-Pro aminopeptidase
MSAIPASAKNSPKARMQCLAKELRDQKLDAALVSDPYHICYLTGLSFEASSTCNMLHGGTFPSFLGISSEGKGFLLVANSAITNPFFGMEDFVASEDFVNGPLYTYGDFELEKRLLPYPDFVAEELGEVFEAVEAKNGFKFGRLGFEDWHLPGIYKNEISKLYPSIEMVSISQQILSMRKTKGSDEVEKIRAATDRLEFAFDLAKPLVKVGNNELELFNEVKLGFSRKYGAQAFLEGDLISGERTLDVVGNVSNRQFSEGDAVILGLNTKFDNYWSKGSRTFIAGQSSSGKEHLMNVLKEGMLKAEKLLFPGTKGKEIYQALSDELKSAGYPQGLIHQAGHGVGVEAIEPPFFLPNSQDTLEEGVVCTLEPGLYDSSATGVRMGGCYLITKNGFERLNSPNL